MVLLVNVRIYLGGYIGHETQGKLTTTMKMTIETLTIPRKFITCTPRPGKNVCRIVTNTITAIAIPRSFHAVVVWPAATRIFEAKTIHPEAVKPRRTACVENRT